MIKIGLRKQRETHDIKKIRRGYSCCNVNHICLGCPYQDGSKKCLEKLMGDMMDKIEELDERIGIMTEEEA